MWLWDRDYSPELSCKGGETGRDRACEPEARVCVQEVGGAISKSRPFTPAFGEGCPPKGYYRGDQERRAKSLRVREQAGRIVIHLHCSERLFQQSHKPLPHTRCITVTAGPFTLARQLMDSTIDQLKEKRTTGIREGTSSYQPEGLNQIQIHVMSPFR